jgi:hypothetical protein
MLDNLNLLARRLLRFLKTGSIEAREVQEYSEFIKSNPDSYRTAFFNLTIDFELAWSRARRRNISTTSTESLIRARRARASFPCLIELTIKYDIPVTIAPVAHVAMSDCASHETPPKFKPSWTNSDWFSVDPKTNLSKNKDYYGFDLMEKVLESDVGHEIASHGFSHIDLSDEETTKEVAEYEIAESYRILKQIDQGLSTFIFPNNRPEFLEFLGQVGYTIYRGKENKTVAKDNFGLWCFPRGLWLSPYAASPKEINELISLATQKKQLVNLWCHLYEFRNAEQLINFFNPIFEFIKRKQAEGSLEVGTMRSIISKIKGIKPQSPANAGDSN